MIGRALEFCGRALGSRVVVGVLYGLICYVDLLLVYFMFFLSLVVLIDFVYINWLCVFFYYYFVVGFFIGSYFLIVCLFILLCFLIELFMIMTIKYID